MPTSGTTGSGHDHAGGAEALLGAELARTVTVRGCHVKEHSFEARRQGRCLYLKLSPPK